jgi:Legume lectin domain
MKQSSQKVTVAAKFVTLFLALICLYSSQAKAQLNYTEFTPTTATNLTFLEDAALVGNSIKLNPNQFPGKAAVWNNTKHRVIDGFVSMFTFRIANPQGPTGGADGFAFVIQNSAITSPMGIGGGGGNIGYGKDTGAMPVLGIMKSLAIEFDTFKNAELGDADNNHISFHTNNLAENSANESSSLMRVPLGTNPNLKDGATHIVRIEYDGATSTTPFRWRIYIDNLTTPRMMLTKDISMIIGAGETDAYVGFTAGVANDFENHDILNWSFSPRFLNLTGAIAPDATFPEGSQTLSTAEYHPGADANNNNLNAIIDTAVLPDRKTELWSKYYFPNNLSGGPYPVVVLLHGNHGTCGIGFPRNDGDANFNQYSFFGTCPPGYVVTPNHRGYDYLANSLTRWGYIVVSINANLGINVNQSFPRSIIDFPDRNKFNEFIDDRSLILARGRLVLRHLQKLSEWNQGISAFATSTITNSSTTTSVTAWYGSKISVGASPITVRSLGRLYLNGNSGNHILRLVRASDRVVVAETSVAMTNWNHLQYKYSDLPSPVTLTANTVYYLASREQELGDQFSRATITTSGVARIVSGTRSYNGIKWGNTGGNPVTYGVDMLYETASSTPAGLGVNLKGKIDFNNVGLMGHSRGGEGMRAAYELFRETNSPWQSRIRGSNLDSIKGIFEFAPTDRSVVSNSNPSLLLRELNANETAWAVLLPSCDGDLFNLRGVKPFDRMIKITNSIKFSFKLKAVYYVYGANHNYYNTQWHNSDSFLNHFAIPTSENGCIGTGNNPLFLNPTDDGAGGYGSIAQRTTGLSPFLAFMRGNVGNSANSNFNQNFDPRFKLPTNVSSSTKIERSIGTATSTITNDTLVFNDLSFPISPDICQPTNITVTCNGAGLIASSSNVQGRLYMPPPPDNPEFIINHDEDFTAANVSWTSPNPRNYFQANWGLLGINLSAFQTLDFRVSRRRDVSNPLQADTLNDSSVSYFSIQLISETGTVSKSVAISKYLTLEGPVGTSNQTVTNIATTPPSPFVIQKGELHPILQTVRIPLSDFTGVDITKIKNVRFVFNDTQRGSINISNIRFSKLFQ